MNPSFECMPCILGHLVRSVKNSQASPGDRKKIVSDALAFMSEHAWNLPPPLMARKIGMMISECSNIKDPYMEIKDLSTEKALSLLPKMKEIVKKSPAPFESAVRISIAGNIIDFGANHNFSLDSVQHEIDKSMTLPIDLAAVDLLENKMRSAKKILYLADNCGEAVLDRLLIEHLREKIILAVKGAPILNDMTRREAAMSGYEDICEIIDTGDSTPGVWLEYSSENFRKIFSEADLIVSKGQGNYETLSDCGRPIFFLLKAKCAVVASHLKTEIGSLNIIPHNIA